MRLRHVLQLSLKEIRGLLRDPLLMVLVAYAFTLDVYVSATAIPESLNSATIGIVDEDASPLSRRVAGWRLALTCRSARRWSVRPMARPS